MSIDSVIRRARRRQAVQFTQTASIKRPIGEVTFDPQTRQSAQQVETTYSSVPCKMTSPDSSGNDVAAAETEVRLIDRMVKFPVGTVVAEDDLVTILCSTYDEVDVGMTYRIVEVDRREWQVARRCRVEEVSVPRLWEAS